MKVMKENRWKNTNTVFIPPADHQGFQGRGLDREIWHTDPKAGRSIVQEPAAQQPVTRETSGRRTAVQTAPEIPAAPVFQARSLRLTRIGTGETIPVTSDSFMLGKSVKADYTIKGNPAVSRIHAHIYRIGNDYYIEDRNSLNHTFVDEEMITGPCLLRDGLVIRLGNEDFILRME